MGLFDFLKRRRDVAPAPSPEPPLPPTVVEPRAATPGNLDDLPADLPPGEYVHDEQGRRVAWLVVAPPAPRTLWRRLVAEFPDTGLWPVVASGDGEELERPWKDREFDGPGATIGDAEHVLRAALAGYSEGDDEEEPRAEPWRHTFAGLSPAAHPGGPVTLPVPDEVPGIALVPVTRPADVPAQLGWWGTINHGLTGGDVSAVLRSWEDRFGAVLVGMGFDTLDLHVSSPPSGHAAELAAREWFAFCPDAVDQGVESIEALTDAASDSAWWFWWD